MNLILERTDQVRWFTNMRDVFDAANIAPQDYDWYVSNIETNWRPPGFMPDDQWFCGDDLFSFLRDHEVQFIWAVFSAVPKGFRSSPSSAPYVEDNPGYWNGTEPRPQLEGALFEIACWDSSGTILSICPKMPPIHSRRDIRTPSPWRPPGHDAALSRLASRPALTAKACRCTFTITMITCLNCTAERWKSGSSGIAGMQARLLFSRT
jgi:hypothetical protein